MSATPKPISQIPRPEDVPTAKHTSRARGPLGALCRANGVNFYELSAAAGVSRNVLKAIDKGRVRQMRFEVVLRVAWACGISAAELCPLLGAKPGPATGLFAVRSARRRHVARVARRIREQAEATAQFREHVGDAL